MKKLLSIIAATALVTMTAGLANAQLSLYDQEGTAADGTPSINAAGQAPAGSTAADNWKWQSGAGSYTGVYGSNGWIDIADSGDSSLEVEADIEMFYTESWQNNKIYFHLGNIYTATAGDLTAFVNGTMTTNNGMYIGVSFDGANKDISSFEKDTAGNFTGKIIGGMVSDRHVYGLQKINGVVAQQTMDLEILLADGTGTGYMVPVTYGDGAHNTVHDTLWWLPGAGAPGSYNLQYRVKLLPVAHQPDGDYYLDPMIVSAPEL